MTQSSTATENLTSELAMDIKEILSYECMGFFLEIYNCILIYISRVKD